MMGYAGETEAQVYATKPGYAPVASAASGPGMTLAGAIGRLDVVSERLEKLAGSVHYLADNLGGGRPEAPSNRPSMPTSPGGVGEAHARINRLEELLDTLQSGLQRLNAAIG